MVNKAVNRLEFGPAIVCALSFLGGLNSLDELGLVATKAVCVQRADAHAAIGVAGCADIGGTNVEAVLAVGADFCVARIQHAKGTSSCARHALFCAHIALENSPGLAHAALICLIAEQTVPWARRTYILGPVRSSWLSEEPGFAALTAE